MVFPVSFVVQYIQSTKLTIVTNKMLILASLPQSGREYMYTMVFNCGISVCVIFMFLYNSTCSVQSALLLLISVAEFNFN